VTETPQFGRIMLINVSIGVPFKSLRSSYCSQLGPGTENHYDSLKLTTTRRLATHPIWPGFAINTIFYAAILWLLFAAPGFVRRRLRARRGQCPACAYPVGSSNVCTECGRPVKSRNAETQKAEMV
jgi:hypothetical protein